MFLLIYKTAHQVLSRKIDEMFEMRDQGLWRIFLAEVTDVLQLDDRGMGKASLKNGDEVV